MNRMKSFLAASLVVFALVGVATTMLGPMLPVMAAQWKLTDTQSGLLFVAQFCGGFLGAIASTSLIQWSCLRSILFSVDCGGRNPALWDWHRFRHTVHLRRGM